MSLQEQLVLLITGLLLEQSNEMDSNLISHKLTKDNGDLP
jgi:hypothetical protein